MQEFVVGILSTWICLLRRVARAVIHYMDAKEVATAEEDDEQD